MCGIVGIVHKRKNAFFGKHLDLFQEMLWADAIRGPDSTGAFSVLNNTQVKVIKNEGSPEFLINTKAWDKFRQSAISSAHVLVGHNRKATQGQISRENAHPFAEDNIILVHNGTLWQHKQMKDVDVDSHAICHSIAEKGYKETIENLEGSFSLVWYDITSKKLHLIRNDQRPLCIAETEEVFAFASEGYMLGWLLNRNDIKFEKIKLLTPMILSTIEFGPFKLTEETIVKKPPLPVVDTGEDWEILSAGRYRRTYSPPKLPSPSISLLKDTMGIMTKYSLYEKIIFIPKRMEEDSIKGRWKITGIGYLPGKPIIDPVTWLTPVGMEFEDAMDLTSENKLLGTVRNIYTNQAGEIQVCLEKAEPEVELTTWNNEALLTSEWQHIVEVIRCVKCHKSLLKDKTNTSSVVMDADNPQKIRCVCNTCVEAAKDRMPQALGETLDNSTAIQ